MVELFFFDNNKSSVSILAEVSQKSVTPNPKQEVFFTKTVCQGMKLIAWGKSNRPRVPRPVVMINFTKIYSEKESETNG